MPGTINLDFGGGLLFLKPQAAEVISPKKDPTDILLNEHVLNLPFKYVIFINKLSQPWSEIFFW